MPEIVRIPNGTTKFGKPRYRKVIRCTTTGCGFEGTVSEVREHEREHRNEH